MMTRNIIGSGIVFSVTCSLISGCAHEEGRVDRLAVDALEQRCERAQVSFELKDQKSAGEMRPAGETGTYTYRYVVMPMRI